MDVPIQTIFRLRMSSAKIFRCEWDPALHAFNKRVRIHQTLRVTPAMEAGVAERLWDLSDIVRIVDEWEASQNQES